MRNERHFRWTKGFTFFIIFLPAVFFLGFVVMFLWNAILPEVARVGKLGYWQGLGLLILSKLLFGGFNKRNWGPDRRHGRFSNLTPEEKDKFKAEWKERCNRWGKRTDTTTTVAE